MFSKSNIVNHCILLLGNWKHWRWHHDGPYACARKCSSFSAAKAHVHGRSGNILTFVSSENNVTTRYTSTSNAYPLVAESCWFFVCLFGMFFASLWSINCIISPYRFSWKVHFVRAIYSYDGFIWTRIQICQPGRLPDFLYFQMWPRYQQNHESGTTSSIVLTSRIYMISK